MRVALFVVGQVLLLQVSHQMMRLNRCANASCGRMNTNRKKKIFNRFIFIESFMKKSTIVQILDLAFTLFGAIMLTIAGLSNTGVALFLIFFLLILNTQKIGKVYRFLLSELE